MAVDFKTFLNVVPFVTSVNKPVLLRGRHGIGKSQVVYQYAESVDLPVVERRASQMTEGDLIGLPSVDGGRTNWNPPNWFKTACEQPVVLFLDEVDRATIEVRQGIFELTDSRKLNGHSLHEDTLIFAAINGGEHGAQYQVGDMDPAELDRWTVFDVEPSVEDWLDWATDNVSTMVWDFVNQNRQHLEHMDEFEPNKVYPSRRSWHRFDECLQANRLLDDGSEPASTYSLATAFVGFEAAVAFQDFIANYDRQVSVENLLDEGKMDMVEDFGINEHTAMIDKLEAAQVFEAELSEERVQNLADYIVMLPSEVAMKLWTLLGNGPLDNTVAVHRSTSRSGKKVSAYLVEILGDSEKEEN
jgi:hypothetical protein